MKPKREPNTDGHAPLFDAPASRSADTSACAWPLPPGPRQTLPGNEDTIPQTFAQREELLQASRSEEALDSLRAMQAGGDAARGLEGRDLPLGTYPSPAELLSRHGRMLAVSGTAVLALWLLVRLL